MSFKNEADSELNETASFIMNEERYGVVFVCAEEDFLDKEVPVSIPENVEECQEEQIQDVDEDDVQRIAKNVIPFSERKERNKSTIVNNYSCYFQFIAPELVECEIALQKELRKKFNWGFLHKKPIRVGFESNEFGDLSFGFISDIPYIIQYLGDGDGYSIYKAVLMETITTKEKSDYPFSDIVDALFGIGTLEIPRY